MYLAQNIKFLREKNHMSQEELSQITGNTSQTAAANWEAGRREPDVKTIIKIAECFNVTLDDLILHELKPKMPLYVSNIRFLRKKNRMSQEDISKLLGLRAKSQYCKRENGDLEFTIWELERLCDFFGVSMDRLVKQDLAQGGE